MARFALLLVVVLALAFASTRSSAFAGDVVTVHASRAEVSFPRAVRFYLDAESAPGITDVQLQVRTPGQRYGSATRNLRPTFTPGARVQADWTWARLGASLPPGAEVVYRWRITDAAGLVTETDPVSVRVEDNRYTWRELREGPLTLRWYRGDDRFGRELLAEAREAMARLERAQGVEPRHPLTIHVYGSQADLFAALPGVPEWVAGIAIPEFDTVMVGLEPGNLDWGRRLLTHELAHQIVYQMTAHPTLGSRVPTWLNEGLAVVAEGDTEAGNRDLIAEAVATDSLPTLRTLAAPFSRNNEHLAGLAYAASENAVRFLLDEYSAEHMRALLLALADGATPDEAARRAYGRSLDELEDAWRKDLTLRPFDRGQPGSPGPDAAPTLAAVPGTSGAAWLPWAMAALGVLAVGAGAAGVWVVRRRV